MAGDVNDAGSHASSMFFWKFRKDRCPLLEKWEAEIYQILHSETSECYHADDEYRPPRIRPDDDDPAVFFMFTDFLRCRFLQSRLLRKYSFRKEYFTVERIKCLMAVVCKILQIITVMIILSEYTHVLKELAKIDVAVKVLYKIIQLFILLLASGNEDAEALSFCMYCMPFRAFTLVSRLMPRRFRLMHKRFRLMRRRFRLVRTHVLPTSVTNDQRPVRTRRTKDFFTWSKENGLGLASEYVNDDHHGDSKV